MCLKRASKLTASTALQGAAIGIMKFIKDRFGLAHVTSPGFSIQVEFFQILFQPWGQSITTTLI